MSDDEVERHLAGCFGCRSWEDRARELTRALRVRPVGRAPDLVHSVVESAASQRRFSRRQWSRVLLACVAVCQIALSAWQVLGLEHSFGHAHASGALSAGHLLNESTAWNLALGLGLLWCSYQVRATAGLVPVLSAFLAVLTGFCVADFINAAVSVGRLASHGLLVLGLALLLMIHRDLGRRRPGPGDVQKAGEGVLAGGTDHRRDELAEGAHENSRRHLPPIAFRRVG